MKKNSTSGSAPVLKSATTFAFQTLSALVESLVILLPVFFSQSLICCSNTGVAGSSPPNWVTTFRVTLPAPGLLSSLSLEQPARQEAHSSADRPRAKMRFMVFPPIDLSGSWISRSAAVRAVRDFCGIRLRRGAENIPRAPGNRGFYRPRNACI